MLLFDTLVQFFQIKQEKLPKLYTSTFIQSENKNSLLESYISLNGENKVVNDVNINSEEYNNTFTLSKLFAKIYPNLIDYTVTFNNHKHSFIYSILQCIDGQFVLSNDKNNYIFEFRKQISIDLDEKNLHRKFNYVGSRKMKKNILQSILLNFEKIITDAVMQYIVDYFGLNVYIFDQIDSRRCINVSYIFSKNDTDTINQYKPTIFLLKKKFNYSLISNKNKENLFIYSKNINILEYLYKSYVISLSTSATAIFMRKKAEKAEKEEKEEKDMEKNIDKIVEKVMKKDNGEENIDKVVANEVVDKINEENIVEKESEIKDVNIIETIHIISDNNLDKKILSKPLKQLLLKDLQNLAEISGIDIKKNNLKNNAKILKTKHELYDELIRFYN